ncbi:MAG: DUF4412 domain-containing protein [Desulfarculus sp.]|jgi:hypothetical protein|nr:MAG: DUF4412 domain-containing protein [Desulfarculus sp.]
MKIRCALLVLALALALNASSALAGWVLEQETAGQPITVYVQDNKVRSGDGEHGVIYDLNAGTVTMLNPGQKQYWTGRPEELTKQMNQAMDAQMEQMLKQAPPEQRQQMRQMLMQQMGRGPQGPAEQVTIKATGKTQDVAGYRAKQYLVSVNGQARQELWVAAVPGLSRDLDMTKLFKLLQQMKMPGRQEWRSSPRVAAVMSGAYPLKMVDLGGGPGSVTVTKKIQKKSLPADLFQPPKGWSKTDFKQMMQR